MPFDEQAASAPEVTASPPPAPASGGFDEQAASAPEATRAPALAAPASGGFDEQAASAPETPRPTPQPQRHTQIKPRPKQYQPPGWDTAFNQGLNAVTGAIGNAFNAYQRLERPIDALSYGAVHRTPKAQHLAGTALEQVGAWMPWTVAASAAGALGSDLASSNPTAQYSADWTQRMLHGDAVGATDEYFPTSAAELKRLDQSGVPVVSQIAHQARNHPKITGALTTLAMLGSPNLEGHIVDAMRIAGQRAAPVIARNAGRAGRATWRATGLPGTPVGNAAEGAARKVGHYGNVVKEAARRSFGTPAIDLLNTVPNNPEARNSVQNKGMAFLHAQGRARSTAANATKYAFRPRHRATADAVGPGRWVGGGSSPEEAAIAIHLRQNLAFHEAFDTAPQPIQDAATAMNASWEKFKANPYNEKQIADAYMAELPRDATGKPIWSAMDISFAPDEFIEREANVKGIPEAQHGAVYTAARNQFLALQGQAQLDAAIAKLSPASQVNVARMAGGIKRGYDDYEAAAKATDPSLLPNERVGYFPAYDTLEETPEQAAERAAPTGSRGAKSMSRPYRRHAKYGSISQMQAAGLDPFSGLSPVDAMYRDLAKKYGDVHKARAFATLGAQVGHRGETLLNRQEYRDPETGETLDYAEAHRRAKQRFLDRSQKSAAANLGYELDPRTMRPTILPPRIENPASAKARLEEATREAKGQQKLQNQLGTEGTRAVDATVKDSLKKEDAAEKLSEKVDTHGNAIKGAHYEQTETTRKAWEQQRDRTKTAIAAARARLAASPNSTALQAQIKGLEKHLARLEDALSGGDAYQAPLYGPEGEAGLGKPSGKTEAQLAQENLAKGVTRAQDSAKGKVGRAAEKARKVISGRSVRTSSDVAKFTQRLKDLHKASIGLSQDARHRLEAIARKYADAGNNRYLELKLREQLARMDTATLAKFKAKVEEIQALANEDEGQVASIVKDEYKAGNPNSGYQVRDPHYRNAQDLKAIIGNIPNLDPDHRIARDAYDFFVHNQMPPRVASEFAKMMSQLDSLGKMGVVYNPIQHAIYNLAMVYIAATRDLVGLAKALPMLTKTAFRFDEQWDAWTQEKAATIQHLEEAGVLHEGGFMEQLDFIGKRAAQREPEGLITGYETAPNAEQSSSAMQRAVTRKSALPKSQWIQKGLEALVRFNAKVVFDRFEKWYFVNMYEHKIAQGIAPSIAERAVRDTFHTDLITPFEQQTIQRFAWFYPWAKTVIPFAIAAGIHNPTWWNAYVQGARVEREGEGAGDMRRSSPFTYVGKDPRGGFDTFTPSLPQRLLEIPANMAIKTPGESNIDRYEPGFNFLDTHLNPLAGTALGAAEEVGTRGKTPGYSQPFDPNAGPLEAAGEVGAHLLGGYLNPAKQAADFTKEVVKDPGGFIGDILSHLAVLNKGYRLQGDNVGGEAPGSPAARYWAGYEKNDRTFKPFAPGAKHENAAVYARKQAALERLYQRYPMMRP